MVAMPSRGICGEHVRGAQGACGSDGLGYGYVGGFDAVVDAERIQPLEIVSAHICRVEPVVCVDCDVFT